VELVEHLGAITIVFAQSDAGKLRMQLVGQKEIHLGERIGVSFCGPLHLFDADGLRCES
jgi:hypothetical protein